MNVPTAEKWSHVVRGGSWADKPDKLRSAARRVSREELEKHDPQEPQSIWWLTQMDVIGFRVVLAEEEQPELDRAEAEGREEVGIVFSVR